jgi:hypothetical protein
MTLLTNLMLFYTQIQTVAFGICTARMEHTFKYAMDPTKICGHHFWPKEKQTILFLPHDEVLQVLKEIGNSFLHV